MGMVFLVKIPMLWLKTSLTALTWSCSNDANKHANVIAILLAWYAIMPAFELAIKIKQKARFPLPIRVCTVVTMLFLLGLMVLHFHGNLLVRLPRFGHQQLWLHTAKRRGLLQVLSSDQFHGCLSLGFDAPRQQSIP